MPIDHKKIEQKYFVVEGDGTDVAVADLLAQRSGLSKGRIKDAMMKGAVWLEPVRGARRRTRRATAALRRGERAVLYYDPDVLACAVPQGRCLVDYDDYSIWYKPPGMLSQGTEYGDHAALLRQVEKAVAPKRDAFIIHRLDSAAAGLMLFAHRPAAAARFGTLLQQRRMRKVYAVEVRGDLHRLGDHGVFDASLDDRHATTRFLTGPYDAQQDRCGAWVAIDTGRYHQIRRHFAAAGFPVVGDRRYGYAAPGGLRLVALELTFACPASGALRELQLTRLAPSFLAGWPWLLQRGIPAGAFV